MAHLAFLANKVFPLYFSFIIGYPHHVPPFQEWSAYFPRFNGNANGSLNQHLKDFHECMKQHGIVHEDVKMKLFMYYLDMDAMVWYKTLHHGSISSLKSFHITYNYLKKILYPPSSLFKYHCEYFNVEIFCKTNDVVEDICGAQLQENIYLHQETLPNNQSKEKGDIVKMQINPQILYFVELDGSPLYDLYELDGELGVVEL